MKFTKNPYLQFPGKDCMTVMWETDVPGETLLKVWDCYSPAIPDGYICENRPIGDPRKFAGENGIAHKATAIGLLPSTDYCYQAITKSEAGMVESDILVLRTAPESGTGFKAAFVAETGGADQPLNVPDIVREMALCRPDIVMFMGDAVWDGSKEEDWNNSFFDPMGSIFESTPFYHVMGNHDCLGRDIAARLMSAPPVNSFVYGDARFVVLDTTCFAKRTDKGDGSSDMRPFDTFNENDPQWQFLEAELSKDDTAWKFVCMHYPPYASALFEAPCMRRLCPVFEKHGVDAVFASHTLHYERSFPLRGGMPAPDGTVYFVIGGVGDYPTWVRHKSLPVTARIMPKPHFGMLEVTPFSLSFKAFDKNGAMFDFWQKLK